MEKQNKNKKHGCFPRPDRRNEIIDALGIGFAAGVVLAILLDRHVRKRRGISFRITAIEPAA